MVATLRCAARWWLASPKTRTLGWVISDAYAGTAALHIEACAPLSPAHKVEKAAVQRSTRGTAAGDSFRRLQKREWLLLDCC